MPYYSATWGSMVCSAAELAATLTVLATILAIMAYLVPEQWQLRG
jgi:hypothetical protein